MVRHFAGEDAIHDCTRSLQVGGQRYEALPEALVCGEELKRVSKMRTRPRFLVVVAVMVMMVAAAAAVLAVLRTRLLD